VDNLKLTSRWSIPSTAQVFNMPSVSEIAAQDGTRRDLSATFRPAGRIKHRAQAVHTAPNTK